MSSKAIKEKHGSLVESRIRETAPSVMRTEVPKFARIVGLIGLVAISLGGVAVLIEEVGGSSRIGAVPGRIFLVLGFACLLFHAASDNDMQVRRAYGLLGGLGLLIGAGVLAIMAYNNEAARLKCSLWGVAALTLSLFFSIPFVKNETDEKLRRNSLYVIGVVGAALALAGFIGGNYSLDFLLPYGLLLPLLGLGFLCAFVLLEGVGSDLGYKGGMALGWAGLLVFLVAFGRSVLPPLFYKVGWTKTLPDEYLVPAGLLLMGLGLICTASAIGMCSDNRLVVMTRRELAGFFYSPIAYVVLFGFTLIGWWNFLLFLRQLAPAPDMFGGAQPQIEPILQHFVINIWMVFGVTVAVPILTMRLLSEESRTGTLEVLLTAPVSETVVVLSKFLAVLLFYILMWLPWGLFLIALRIEGGSPFEYRPLLTFFFALVCSGAGFLSMGLFFSSVTRNQIASAILSFVGMVLMLLIYFARFLVEQWQSQDIGGSGQFRRALSAILMHASYIDLWDSALRGVLEAKYLIFYLSMAVFFLFLTIKVLEARKWK